MQVLPVLATKPLSWAQSDNDAGDIVGYVVDASGKGGRVPWICTPAGGIQEIADFPVHAAAYAISNARAVVGSSGDVVPQE